MAEELQKPAERHAYATPSLASGNSQLSFQGGSSTRSGSFARNPQPKVAPAIPSPEVEVASAVQKDVPIFSEWVATLDGYINAQIQPQVAGYVIRQTYKEGSFVRKGQILF